MEAEDKPQLLFYQKLGELFYAIAAADKTVREAEYKQLTKVVEEEWKSMDTFEDGLGTDAAYQISIVFEWFDYERMDAQDCYLSFSEYYNEHPKLFSEKRKELIRKTVQKIADSFSGTNKSELVMIAKLHLLFKNN
jgi:uncharacterized tellurite resistance protein B-like protein